VSIVSSLMSAQNLNGLTRIDSELVHLHGLLEKKYSNDYDAGHTYIDQVTSDPIPLTPFMMKEWARAMVICSVIMPALKLTYYHSMMEQRPLVVHLRL
jgi:hypothetical protein